MSNRKVKHASKMARKRAAKAARRTKYAALAGTSKKTKNVSKRGTGPTPHKHEHIMANCGNIGCLRCFPRRVKIDPRYAPGKTDANSRKAKATCPR